MSREDITPGATEDDAFGPVDSDKDYEALGEEWDGTPVLAEIALDGIDGDLSVDESVQVEAVLDPPAEMRDPKYLVLETPPDKPTMDAIIDGVLSNDRYAVVSNTVYSPEMTRNRWRTQLDERDRTVLYGMCCQFLRMDEILDPELVEMVRREQQNQAE